MNVKLQQKLYLHVVCESYRNVTSITIKNGVLRFTEGNATHYVDLKKLISFDVDYGR